MLMCEHGYGQTTPTGCPECVSARQAHQRELRRRERNAFSWMCPTHCTPLEGTVCPACPPVVDAKRVVELSELVVQAAVEWVTADAALARTGSPRAAQAVDAACVRLTAAVEALGCARGGK
jgi:hypothetical protein